MLFNSIDFAIFLPIVFILYWFATNNNLKLQNFLIVAASYLFYGWWDWRFLSLILFSTIVDYSVGRKLRIEENQTKRKILLWTSILVNLGLLGFFKYYNFFLDNFLTAFSFFGTEIKANSLNIILPVGISFYTFQTLSYSIDVYKRKLEPTKDFISFSAFVSFFPQLVAGPIERASNLLPQILSNRIFKYEQGVQGLRLILYGMFKKVVIADSLAPHVDIIFDNYTTFNGGVLLLGLIYFSFQIYCDFSGYSDIAIGTSKLFGFELMSNFKFPYFSRNIGEFWRRWHISLSTWFRDYLYIPLGGSKDSKWLSIRNIFIIFIVSGFWHGPNWTFIMWGLIHAMLYIPLFLRGKNRRITSSIVGVSKWFPSFKELFQMGSTFFFTMIAWVFFRSQSIESALMYLFNMFTNITMPNQNRLGIIFLSIFIFIDWIMYKSEKIFYFVHENKLSVTKSDVLRYVIYYVFVFSVLTSLSKKAQFIYFQF